MTPASGLPSPALPWHRTVAWTGVAWGVCELGICLWAAVSELTSSGESLGFASAMALLGLGTLATLLLPAGPLLLRRCLPLAAYQLAGVPAALSALFLVLTLLSLLLDVGYGRGTDLATLALVLAALLARGAVAGALLSASRHRARMYGQAVAGR